jgi:RNA polymerase sigma factor (sigma-70 family)
MIRIDPGDIEAARFGDRAALGRVLRACETPIYNIALRMLAHPADAEDATQEVLIRVATHLGGLRDPSAAGAWALRIGCRHIIRLRRKSRIEAQRLTFDSFEADLAEGRSEPDGLGLTPAELALALGEVKVGCTLAMLTCLTRPLRIAYVLGEIFELSDNEAAAALEISPPAYRQRLSRAREQVTTFTQRACGLVSDTATCRCANRIAPALARHRITRGQASYGPDVKPFADVERTIAALEEGRRGAALMRTNPQMMSHVRERVLAILDLGRP